MNTPLPLVLASLLVLAACSDPPPPAADSAPASTQGSAAPADGNAGAALKLTSQGTSEDRLPPPIVPPVEKDGVRYSQAEDGRDVGQDQVGGVLVASDAASGKRLWTLVVYGNPLNPSQEADSQWIFFKSMGFASDGSLVIVNEADSRFLVDLKNRTVTQVP